MRDLRILTRRMRQVVRRRSETASRMIPRNICSSFSFQSCRNGLTLTTLIIGYCYCSGVGTRAKYIVLTLTLSHNVISLQSEKNS